MTSLGELFDHFFIKRRNVRRLTTRYQAVINYYFTIDPVRARMNQIAF